MPLPSLNADGDLPPGIHRATMEEVMACFDGQNSARKRCTRNLRHIFELAKATRHLERMIVFGSYVSAKAAPNDVDVILIMSDAFSPTAVDSESRLLFDHAVSQYRFGASVFWITPAITLGETLESFVSHWQRKRDGELRGIVEIIS